MELSIVQMLALASGGVVAGVVNTMAGGGSLLTVPLLVMLGLPGTVANGTNRVGVLVQSVVATWRFGAEGVPGVRAALPLVAPLMMGSAVGAVGVSLLPDATFERLFGIVMLVLMVPALRPATDRGRGGASGRELSPAIGWAMFFAIGIFGGAIQAGVGILLVLALARAGHDLVLANSIKVGVVALFTTVAVAVFVWQGQVRWLPAAILAASTSVGAVLGARLTVRGGERVLRPVLALAVALLAGRMLGLY